MSIQLIQQYHAKVEKIIRYGGSRNESALRKPFQDLLEQYAQPKNLLLVPEVEVRRAAGGRVDPDGTLKDALRQDWGYWESKDEKDDLAAEIAAKFAKGYPTTQHPVRRHAHRRAVPGRRGSAARRLRRRRRARCAADPLRRLREPRRCASSTRPSSSSTPTCPRWPTSCARSSTSRPAPTPAFRQALDEFLELCKKAINPHDRDGRRARDDHPARADRRHLHDASSTSRSSTARTSSPASCRRWSRRSTTARRKRNIHARIAPYYETINARAAQICQPSREAEVPQGALRELLPGLQPQGRRPAGRSSTRPTRSCAS